MKQYRLVGMPRTSSHRDKLLESAQSLMRSKGFPATGVNEICKAAGVTKGSFYHHFESKEALAFALVEHYFDKLAGAFAGQSWLAESDPKAQVYALLDCAIQVLRGPLLKHGCLLGSFALDLSETHPELRSIIEQRFESLIDMLEPSLRAALRGKPKRAGINAKTLARQFMAVLQGSIVLAKASADHDQLAAAMRCYKAMLKSVLEA